MGTTALEIQIFQDIISQERLTSYRFDVKDSLELLYARYIYNIKISETFYPILSALEIALRNKLHSAITKIKGNDWLLKEIITKDVLSDNERKLVIEANKKLVNKAFKELNNINKQKAIEEQETQKRLWDKAKNNVKSGGLIAELTFGFWINLCKKAYKNLLWDRQGFFNDVFPDFDKFFSTTDWDKTKIIFPELKNILTLRNRIFHHEIIINNKSGIEYCYNQLEKVLCSLSEDYTKMVIDTFRFRELLKQKP